MIDTEVTLDTTINELCVRGIISIRTCNCFTSLPGFVTLGDILRCSKPKTEFLRYRNIGKKTINEYEEIREAYSYLLDIDEGRKDAIQPPTYDEVKKAYQHYRRLHELYLLHTLRGTGAWCAASLALDKRLAVDSLPDLTKEKGGEP